MKGVLDDALDRSEAGCAGDENDRQPALAQVERAERSFEAQFVADFHLREHMGREPAAGDPTDMQFDVLVLMGRVGERESAPLPVREQDIDVLSGDEIEALAGRQRNHEPHDLVRQAFHAVHGSDVGLYACSRRRADRRSPPHGLLLSVVEIPYGRNDEAPLQRNQFGAMQARELIEQSFAFREHADFDPPPVLGRAAALDQTEFLAA